MGEVIDDCINKAFNEAVSYDLCEYYKAFFNGFTDAFETNKYNLKNLKPIDNNIAIGIALSPADTVYNKLLKPLKVSFTPKMTK